MANEKSWTELLKDPRWQRMRLEVMKLSDFTCEDCGSATKTLHVHHSYYEKGFAPWDYPLSSLHCLCEDCHRNAQDLQLLLKRQIGNVELGDVPRLLGYAAGLDAAGYPNTVIDVFSYEVALGIGDAWGLSAEEVIAALEEGSIDGWRLAQLKKAKRS